MNKKAVILLLGAALAMSGAIIKGTQNANANLPETPVINANHTSISPKLNNIGIIAQYSGSPWGQVVSSQTYTNPDTGQTLCFYSSSRWAPCPGQGDNIIIPPNAKCRGGQLMEDVMNHCPAAQCSLDNTQSRLGNIITGGSGSSVPPCTGLP
jgi:hypothetical protein